MREKILVVAAHPDDEVLGCGGTIKRLTQENNNLYIAILSQGIISRFPKIKKETKRQIEKLKESALRASKLFKAKDCFLFDFPDNKFDTVPFLEIVKKIENLIRKIQPTVIFTHHGSDLNIDHNFTHRAVLTATRPIKNMSVREIYTFETPSSTEWSFGQFKPVFSPNVFYDIGKTLDDKIKALKIYESEIRKFPHPRSPEALIAIAKRWGSMVGVMAAEAFELLRIIR